MMLTQNLDAGQWTVQFQAYIPAGRGAYFNIQGETENEGAGGGGAGVFNSSNLYFNQGATNAGVFLDELQVSLKNPRRCMVSVTIAFDLDAVYMAHVHW